MRGWGRVSRISITGKEELFAVLIWALVIVVVAAIVIGLKDSD